MLDTDVRNEIQDVLMDEGMDKEKPEINITLLNDLDMNSEVLALQRMLNRISMLTVLQEDVDTDKIPTAVSCAIELANTIKYLKSDVIDSSCVSSSHGMNVVPIYFEDEDEE